jgi:hypothetical protein
MNALMLILTVAPEFCVEDAEEAFVVGDALETCLG